MRQLALFLCVALLILGVPAGADDGDAVLGKWLTAIEGDNENGRSHIEIYKDKGRYHGRIVWLEKPTYPPDDEKGMGGQSRVDRENPDPALRTRPIMGLPLMEGFKYAGKNQWKSGTIYDPEIGKTYKCKMRLEGDVLHVRGYIGFSLLGRTTEWTRVTE